MKIKNCEITSRIKETIKNLFWKDEDGRIKISLGNHRLDFKKDYYVEKFTKFGMVMYYYNGTEKIKVIGKVYYNEEYKDFSLYTEGMQYIETLKVN